MTFITLFIVVLCSLVKVVIDISHTRKYDSEVLYHSSKCMYNYGYVISIRFLRRVDTRRAVPFG